jgi:hypothetical protein
MRAAATVLVLLCALCAVHTTAASAIDRSSALADLEALSHSTAHQRAVAAAVAAARAGQVPEAVCVKIHGCAWDAKSKSCDAACVKAAFQLSDRSSKGHSAELQQAPVKEPVAFDVREKVPRLTPDGTVVDTKAAAAKSKFRQRFPALLQARTQRAKGRRVSAQALLEADTAVTAKADNTGWNNQVCLMCALFFCPYPYAASRLCVLLIHTLLFFAPVLGNDFQLGSGAPH